MNAQIAVMTDSTADIPEALAAARQIYSVPMHIVWEGVDLRDRIDIDADTFYARLTTARELPTTSQPSLSELTDAYERARAETGAAAVIILTLSSRLSGVYNAASQAAKLVDFPVHVIDSQTGSIAAGLAALGLADARDAGIGPAEAVRLARDLVARTRMIFALDTLEYLYRSGRVSNLQRLLGNALRIKPLLHVKEGGIVLLEQVRTRQRMLKRLLEVFDEVVDRSRPLHVGVLHSMAPDDLQTFMEEIRQRYQPGIADPQHGLRAGRRPHRAGIAGLRGLAVKSTSFFRLLSSY